jgi:hypothetical protein
MQKLQLFFDMLDYAFVRLFLFALAVLGAAAVLKQHWPRNRPKKRVQSGE